MAARGPRRKNLIPPMPAVFGPVVEKSETVLADHRENALLYSYDRIKRTYTDKGKNIMESSDRVYKQRIRRMLAGEE